MAFLARWMSALAGAGAVTAALVLGLSLATPITEPVAAMPASVQEEIRELAERNRPAAPALASSLAPESPPWAFRITDTGCGPPVAPERFGTDAPLIAADDELSVNLVGLNLFRTYSPHDDAFAKERRCEIRALHTFMGYPEAALAERLEGEVEVRYAVDDRGEAHITSLTASHPVFETAVRNAIGRRLWPASAPVSDCQYSVQFRLAD